MTPAEHYREASRLAAMASERLNEGDYMGADVCAGVSRAHAAVAVAASTDNVAAHLRKQAPA